MSKTEEFDQKKKYTGPLVVLTTLFFMWGFITCMNDILIPFLRKTFELGRFESMLVQFAFFGAYFIGSLIYFIVSASKGDPISKIGYKKGIIAGLLISAFACALFFPAAEIKIYGLFLTALFILGLGFTLLQIAANPYVAILGSEKTASSRLNLAQAFNSFGTTIAPIIGGFLLFHFFARIGSPLLNQMGDPILTEDGTSISKLGVQIPYLIFAGFFLLLAVVIKFTKLPQFTNTASVDKGMGALKHRHLVLGMIAIFMYVGGEVSIGSVLMNFMNELNGFSEMTAKSYLAFYWGGAMIGRFLGAISLSDKGGSKKILYMVITSILSFGIIYLAVFIESGFTFKFSNITPFLLFMLLNLVAFKFGNSLPGRTLMIFALVVVGLLLNTMFTSGSTALWSILSIGLFNSIMWSNIFTLAIKDLGKDTAQGSSLLVMMILGGALIPLIQGAVADMLDGYHYSFFVPVFCYIYLAYYGWKGYKPKLDIDTKS
ncbi:MAG: MFS transporter [Bacteroidales bacterium]|nr:MFS transporter [Bacteroidales bacterium]